MPEGPEVHSITDVLHARLAQTKLVSFKINDKSRYYSRNKITKLELLREKRLLTGIACRGKKIIFMFERDIFLVSSLGMEGSWQFEAGKHSGIHLVFEADDGKIDLFYDDSRHFGTMCIYDSTTSLWEDGLADVGPDLIDDTITFEYYHSVIRGPRLASKQICLFMMEQKYFSGIGNYARAEILYRCRINPFRTISSLSDDDLKLLWEQSILLLRQSYKSQGATFDTYRIPTGHKGEFQMQVYGRKTDPDGNEVVCQTDKTKRTVHWVPSVQT